MNSQNDPRKAWLKFIENFTSKKFDINEESVKTGDFRFFVENFLDTGINLNDSYGFLTVDFRDNRCKWDVQDFISAAQIIYTSERLENITLNSTTWSPEDFPCRIYGADNNGRIRFYKSDDITEPDKILNSYITVFRSVVCTIIRLKISDAME